jgi:hypothetical protein
MQSKWSQAGFSPPDQALWEKVATHGSKSERTGLAISLRDFPTREMRLTLELFGQELRDVIAT